MAVARTFALGVEKATGLVPGGFDVMRVDFNENQASNLIYGAGSRHVTGYAYPTAGGAVCTSLGMSQALDCGFVGQTSVTYTLYADDGRFIQTVNGGTSTGLNVVPGDSGSPIHVRGTGTATAIGVLSGVSGSTTFFGRVSSALGVWGWQIFT